MILTDNEYIIATNWLCQVEKLTKIYVHVYVPHDDDGGDDDGGGGLDLFNNDTRPSGHISRPAQVNVSQSGFHSLNNYSSLIILYTSGG